MSTLELRKLGAFGRQISQIIPEARDLDLLGAIEKTVEAIADETVKFQSLDLMAEHFLSILQKADFTSEDALAQLEKVIPASLEILEKYYNTQVAKRQSAIEDLRLTEEDGIVEAYDSLLHEICSLHNNLNSLCWVIGEHAAELDKKLPGSYSNADDLFEAMGV